MVIRTLSYDSLLILTNKVHCTPKTTALKRPVFKSERYMLGNFMSLLSSVEFSFKLLALKMSFSNTSRFQTVWIQIMPDIFSLVWV